MFLKMFDSMFNTPHPSIHPILEERECENGSATTFVDDSSIVVTSKIPSQLPTLAHSGLDTVSDYLTANKLKVN